MNSLGDSLRREREARGISLQDISAVTKISVRLLEAIETEAFERLPGGVFNVNFVRQYARHVGLDEEEAVAEYRRLAAPPEPATSAPSGIPPDWAAPKSPNYDWDRRSQPRTWMLLILVGVALGLAVYLWRRSSKPPPALSDANNASQAASSKAAASPPDSAPASVPVTKPATETPPEAATADALGPPPDAPVRVELQATDFVWISAIADGQPLFAVTLRPGDSRLVTAASRVRLRVGNAAGLILRLNGIQQAPLGAKGQRLTVVLTPQGMEIEASPPAATAPPVPSGQPNP